MAYVSTVKTSKGTGYKAAWREFDPKTGKAKLRYKSFYGGTKKQALGYAKDQEAKGRLHPVSQSDADTLHSFLQEVFIPQSTGNLRPSSRGNMEQRIKNVIRFTPDIPLRKVDFGTVEDMKIRAIKAGYAPNSVRSFVLSLKKALKLAIASDLIRPIDLSSAKSPNVPRFQPKIRSFEESEKLARSFADIGKDDYALMILIGAYTGMRIGEILALTAADIDLAKGRIRVNKTVVKGVGNLPEIQNATKTDAGRRAIPIPPRLRAALEPRVGRLRGDALILPDPGSTARSAPYRVTTVSGVVFNQATKVDVPSGTHCARHNYASHMLTQKTPVHIVSRLLGHSSPQVTLESYAWVLDDQDLDSAVLNVFGGGLTVVGGSEKEAG